MFKSKVCFPISPSLYECPDSKATHSACWVLGFPMNSCFTLHLYSEGDWAHAGDSNPNLNAEDIKHKCVRPLTRRKQLHPPKPQSSQSQPYLRTQSPFRESSSVLPWNWKLAFSSKPRTGRKKKKKKRLSKTYWIINIYEFDKKKVGLLLLGFQLIRWAVKWKLLFQTVLPMCHLAGKLFKSFSYWHKHTYG